MAEVVERGDIYFLYRPRVNDERVESAEEVQRLLMVLRPQPVRRLRLMVVGRKRMPELAEHDRFWAFVDAVVDRPEQLHEAVQRRQYQTKTGGRRVQGPARPVAEGGYVIARHGDHTHLAYHLEPPDPGGPPQRELNIEHEASYIITVKNPRLPSPPGVGRPGRGKADLPAELQERFRNLRFIPLDPPAFLDHPGTEVVLIGATADASRELDVDMGTEAERAAHSKIFEDLRIGREEQPTEPLFAGQWR